MRISFENGTLFRKHRTRMSAVSVVHLPPARSPAVHHSSYRGLAWAGTPFARFENARRGGPRHDRGARAPQRVAGAEGLAQPTRLVEAAQCQMKPGFRARLNQTGTKPSFIWIPLPDTNYAPYRADSSLPRVVRMRFGADIKGARICHARRRQRPPSASRCVTPARVGRCRFLCPGIRRSNTR